MLNLESNYISAQGITGLLEAVNIHQVMSEFRICNQVKKHLLFDTIFTYILCLMLSSLPSFKFKFASLSSNSLSWDSVRDAPLTETVELTKSTNVSEITGFSNRRELQRYQSKVYV